ncbi:translation elongation factor Ts [uncultured Thiothrix sp.]|uniref:translation elongation factor Ts n=1 Tax=uncultured Thiothrix sp. TaxID=223185 RepID=UPI0026096ECA|nr:translation elongation factor Ts [uncultured Thiothrix sp.]HMT92239.1 translation elongation factor Ts [Thiolinea sp.]
MSITAAMVKDLRERTGAGMMECKKALTETNGDMEAAIDLMRKSGALKAEKKSGRIAAEGRVVIKLSADQKQASLVEVNSETDFVAKDSNFIQFAEAAAEAVLASGVTDVAALANVHLASGQTVEEARAALVAKIGENIQVRRAQIIEAGEGAIATYIHSNNKIGVALVYTGSDAEMGKDLAMHVAANNPAGLDESSIPVERVVRERDVQLDIVMQTGKPREIAEKMLEGKMRKFLAELTLLGQAFVKDPSVTVAQLLKNKGASVTTFTRMEAGEGIEKKQENFAEEVAAQARQAG